MTDLEREKIWDALSDIFVDTEIEYIYITRHLKGFDIKEIKKILFREVAPVCGGNLMCVAPPVWGCFNEEEVRADIYTMLEKRKKSFFYRLVNEFCILFFRLFYRSSWLELEAKLQEESEASPEKPL
ncbi:hypothetical protein RGU70_14565 [Herbaspirillum sp. RTI4]|nr:hypothetical protein [Herbaspirillum sp. RTI4]MDY7579536.1 hypothetical protein [Herbaspirillum sp. RTI4]